MLPLDRSRIRRVAIIGPNAAEARIQGGGSASVFPAYSVSPLQGLRAALGDDIDVVHAIGTHLQYGLTPVAAGLVTCPDCGEPGFRVRYLDDGGNLLRAEHRSTGWMVWLGDRKIHGATVEVTARFRASATGQWRIGLAGTGPFRLFLDGEVVLDEVLQPLSDNFVNNLLLPPQRAVARALAEGDEVDVVLVHSLARSDLATLTFGVEAPRGLTTRSSPTPSTWLERPMSPWSSWGPPNGWRPKASTAAPWPCPTDKTTSYVRWRP